MEMRRSFSHAVNVAQRLARSSGTDRTRLFGERITFRRFLNRKFLLRLYPDGNEAVAGFGVVPVILVTREAAHGVGDEHGGNENQADGQSYCFHVIGLLASLQQQPNGKDHRSVLIRMMELQGWWLFLVGSSTCCEFLNVWNQPIRPHHEK